MTQRPAKNKLWRFLIVLGAIGILVGALVMRSFRLGQAECELCVEFGGQRQCRKGSGATAQDARHAAQRAACAVMAAGMSESIACERVPATDVRCGS